MKYDGSRPMTRGAKRTLTAFSNGMLLLLTKKPFDRIYDFTRENRSTVSQILLHNPENGYMVSSFRSFLSGQMREIFQKCMDAAEKEIPKELLADHYSNTLFLVWQWSALKDASCTKEMGRTYLRMLLSKIG